MQISEMRWQNYRRLPDGDIDARGNVVLVGPNDSGKSSLLRALHVVLGMAHGQVPNAITARDFTDLAEILRITVVLSGIDDDDRAAFPDEITAGPPEVLAIAVEATVDPSDPDLVAVRRFFPDGGHEKAPSRLQLEAIGFQFVPAARSLLRELGQGGGIVRSLLAGVDLTADAAALEAASTAYKTALDGSAALGAFRTEVATALSDALPKQITEADVRLVSQAELLDDPLSGVTVTLDDGGREIPLSEQSDGIRAISVLTLLGMTQGSAKIVVIDEPETHLHPAAQRSIARSFGAGGHQRILATHAPAVVGELSPLNVVALRGDRQVRQLPLTARIAAHETEVRHWSHRLIEPLASRHILVVEGPSDRILVRRVADLTGVDLDGRGATIFELNGSGLFSLAYGLFGPDGFDLPLSGLTDEDARQDWADVVGVNSADLEAAGYVVCDPDLEGAYIRSLGVAPVVAMLLASPAITEPSLLKACGVATAGEITSPMLAAYCGHKKHKMRAALAVASGLTPAQGASLAPIVALLGTLG